MKELLPNVPASGVLLNIWPAQSCCEAVARRIGRARLHDPRKKVPATVRVIGGGRPWRGNNNGCKEQKETFELVLAIGRDTWSGSPALKPFLVLDHVNQSFLFLKHRTPAARCPFRQA